jgi:hypothetical protein
MLKMRNRRKKDAIDAIEGSLSSPKTVSLTTFGRLPAIPVASPTKIYFATICTSMQPRGYLIINRRRRADESMEAFSSTAI